MKVESLKKLAASNYQAAVQTTAAPKIADVVEGQTVRVKEHKEAGDMAEHQRQAAENRAADQLFSDKEREITESMMESAIKNANKRLRASSRELEYKIHEKTNRVMVKIINSETKEIIREIPPEKTLDIFAKVLEMAGLMVDEKR